MKSFKSLALFIAAAVITIGANAQESKTAKQETKPAAKTEAKKAGESKTAEKKPVQKAGIQKGVEHKEGVQKVAPKN